MRCHPLDIFHEGNRVLEDAVIDTLQRCSGPAYLPDRKVTQYESLMWPLPYVVALDKFTVDLKLACDGADIVLFVHDQSLFG